MWGKVDGLASFAALSLTRLNSSFEGRLEVNALVKPNGSGKGAITYNRLVFMDFRSAQFGHILVIKATI
jgi:hypothetical protein